jgi:hypothetical protein
MVYGDGCFKDPVGGIWEFADPVVSPYYTDGLEGTPCEIKMKYIIDCNKEEVPSDADNDIREQIEEFHKRENTTDQSSRMGTTPRRYSDLLGSLADLTSGSGDKGTPIVWIKNYFKNWTGHQPCEAEYLAAWLDESPSRPVASLRQETRVS